MFIELSELLDCPACADGCGLVAFVRESDRRRVLTGHLGCPLCEGEVPIHGGVIDLDPSPARPPSGASPGGRPGTPAESSPGSGAADPAPRPGRSRPSEAAVRVAALLGLGSGEGVRAVLLGPGLAGHGSEVARLGGRVEVLALYGDEERDAAFASSVEDLSVGMNPIVGAGAGPWPVRAGRLDGIAWQGALGEAEAAVRAALRPGGRLVLIDPDTDETTRLEAAGMTTLAADATAWVGVGSGR